MVYPNKMNLEYLLALHRKYLEELKITKTFKYSGVVGIILAGISKDLISKNLNILGLILILFIIFIFYVILNIQEEVKQKKSKNC